MKIIGVTQRTFFEPNFNELRDCLDTNWAHFLAVVDILPIVIPNCSLLIQSYLNNISFSGFLLTGGNSSFEREKVEQIILDYAIHASLPTIGVCHGMQTIQKYFGQELNKIEGHIQLQQKITIHGRSQVVNSYHEYGTAKEHPDFNVWAYAEDRILKGIQHKKFPLLGLMWHPERFQSFRSEDINLFKSFYGVSK